MTKRSGSVTALCGEDTRRPAPARRPSGGAPGLRRGHLDDVGHQLAQVVVGLVHDDLAGGPVAVVEDVLDALPLALRAEVLRVLAQPVEQAPHQLARRNARL